MKNNSERIFHHGVPIDQLTEPEALACISQQLQIQDRPRQIVTLNNETYSHARRYPSFRKVLEETWLVLNESHGLTTFTWVVRPALHKIPGGVYLAEKAVNLCAQDQKRVVLVGSNEKNRLTAKTKLKENYPQLDIQQLPGDYSYNNRDANYIVQGLQTLKPDFVLLAGDEIQSQQWIHQHIVLPNTIRCIIGNFGGTIDYLTGSSTQWRPKEEDNKWGISSLIINMRRTPQRRKRALRAMANMAVLAVEDLTHQRH